MAFGFSPVLPLQRNSEDGFYVLTKTLKENIQQNFKNLLLTAPGERVMIPDFGVGLRHYLFEQNSFNLHDRISERIDQQIEEFMPFVTIEEVSFAEEEETNNILSITVIYSVPSYNISEMITVSKNGI